MAEIVLTKEQQAVIDDHGGTLLVSAAAGSGKTKVLIDRVLKRVQQGRNVDDFLLITFTQAAAAELRGKMIARLNELLSLEPQNRHLQKQMNRIYLAQISTVHSFCGTLLREYAHVLDLPADFRTAEESEANLLRNRAMETVLEQAYIIANKDAEILDALNIFGAGRDDRDLPSLIFKVHDSIQCWRDPGERLQQLRQSVYVEDCNDPVQTMWGRYLLEQFKEALNGYEKSIRNALTMIDHSESLQPYAENLNDDLRIIRKLIDANNWFEIQQIPTELSRLKTVRKCTETDLQQRVKAIRKSVKDDLKAWAKSFALSTEELLADIRVTAKALDGLLKIVALYDGEYTKEKLHRHILDYNDLEHQTLRLLLNKNGTPSSEAKEIAERFAEIMVDEYQDTNGVQDAIFGAIAYSGNLFMVGDVKQSIYRFRMADPTGFLNRYHVYADYTDAKEREPRKILLSDNFRSCPEVLSAANDVFRLLMSPNVGGLYYTDAEALRPNLPEHGGRPIELHCIDMKQVPQELHISSDEVEAEFIAGRIRKMLDEGEKIQLRDGARQIRPEDITILMRGVKNSAATYISVLAKHGIKCVCGSENILETPQIATLISLLKVIDNPHQDVPLLSVLFSPMFCFTAQDLALTRANDPHGDLYDSLRTSEKGRTAIQMISNLRDIAAQNDLHTLLDEIEERLYLRAVYPNNAQNFDKLLEMADRYESTDRFSLSGFLRHLEIQREKGVSSEQPLQTGAVRLLTMHKSKGLEFPVVFLAGLNKKFNDQDLYQTVLVDSELGIASKLIDTERSVVFSTFARDAIADRLKKESRSEELRVLYVAMTRAQCRLIMTCCGRTITRKLEKIATEMVVPPLESYVAGASSLGDWILMSAMTRTEAGELFEVGGASFSSRVSEYPWEITYNDAMKLLPMERQMSGQSLDGDELIEFCPQAYKFISASLYPGKMTATQLKGRSADQELEATQVPFPLRFPKPNFEKNKELTATQKGTAIHLAMEHLRYEYCTDVDSIRRELDRLLELQHLTEQQRAVIPAEKLHRFFTSALGKRVLTCKNLVREFKFSILDDASHYDSALQGEEILLQGVTDCCLVEDDGIVILDFKSDRIKEGKEHERAEHYRGQLLAYAQAMARIFQLPVKECVLYFFATDKSVSLEIG